MDDAPAISLGKPRRSWRSALLLALAAVYVPFLVAAIITWTTVDCGHCRMVWFKYVWVFPGLLLTDILRRLVGVLPDLESCVGVAIAAAVCVGLVVGLASLVRLHRIVGRLILLATLLASAWLAYAAYALVRM